MPSRPSGQRSASNPTHKHTSDPHTRLIPGTAGTVTSYDARHGQLAVAWDDGSTLAMLLNDGDQVRSLDSPQPRPESLRSDDGSRIIEIIPRADGSYHVAIKSASGQAIAGRFPRTAPQMLALVQEWARNPALPPPAGAAPSLRALAEAVRCHIPVQPEHPRHGTDPVPVEIFYGPLPGRAQASGAAAGRSGS